MLHLNSTSDIEDLCRKEKASKKQILKKYENDLDSYTKLLLSNKQVRSWSGVLVVTVVMKPDKFSCPHNCHYCPNEPGQPRSYLSTEPAVARANQNDFDALKQVWTRLDMFHQNGIPNVDKIEIIVLGGTFSAYDRNYQGEFITDLYYSVNTYRKNDRKKLGLYQEQTINETNDIKIIGISLETRPDHINKNEIRRLRNFGCTRVQIGVQHTNDYILSKLNRGHNNSASIKAINYLKHNGFKVDIHVMPDLPFTTPIEDKHMLQKIQEDSNYIPDYLKIYPCLDVDYTLIKKWKNDGLWKPYSEKSDGLNTLIDVIIHAKKHSKYYIRYNRIQRDFPEANENTLGFTSEHIKTNLRQIVQNKAISQGVICKCIRCCEIKSKRFSSTKNLKLYVDKYNASHGVERFISYASDVRRSLHGFIRLRFNKKLSNFICFKSLETCAIIRELHVYGFVTGTKNKTKAHGVQHKGFGKALLAYAELISCFYGYNKIAIISGVGVRKYYENQGYTLNKDGFYMVKHIKLYYIFFYLFKFIYRHIVLYSKF